MLLKRLARRAAAIVIACLFGTNVSYVAAGVSENPNTGTSVLGGWVYIDRNNDGELNFDTPDPDDNAEYMISGVTIELCNLDASSSCTTDVTDNVGRYFFEGLPAGSYSLREIQPIQYVNGTNKVGRIYTPGGIPTGDPPGTMLNDVFHIDLPANVHGDYYLFGERGFAAGYVSKRFLTATAPTPPLGFGLDEPGFVPEPGTSYLMAMAAGFGLIPRRRRRGTATHRRS